MAEESEICRNFRNNSGNCRYGEQCRFEHTEGEPIQVPSKPPGQCFKFQESEGQCSKGDRCRFMHGENDPRFDSEGKRDVSNEVCNNYKRGRCQLGEKCLRLHVEPEPQPEGSNEEDGERRRTRTRRPRRGPRMCRNFSQDGECAEGDNCRFKHGADDTRFPDTAEAPAAAERKPRKKKTKMPRGECFVFRDNGSCDRGDECRFKHGEDDTRFPDSEPEDEGEEERKSSRRRRRPPRGDGGGDGGDDLAPRDPSEKIDEECNNYKLARCRFGDACRRVHSGDVTPMEVEKIDEICNNFQNNKCRFGKYCRRQHIAAPES